MEAAMFFPGNSTESPTEDGANNGSDRGVATCSNQTRYENTVVGACPPSSVAGGDAEARLHAMEDRINSLELARPLNTALSPGFEAMLEGINTRLDTLTSGLVQIYCHHGVSKHRLANRISRLSARIEPNDYLFNHINGLTTRVNHIATQANATSTSINDRLAILTKGLSSKIRRIEARLDDLERQADGRFDPQAARFLLQVERVTEGFHTQVQKVVAQRHHLTASRNRLQDEDLSVQGQRHMTQVQEIIHHTANISEKINEELETICANTHAATMAMRPVPVNPDSSLSPSSFDITTPLPPVATTSKNDQPPPPASSILDAPIPEAFVTMSVNTYPEPPAPSPSTDTSTTPPAVPTECILY
ncbi:MAG: hypothetical protein Q9200_003003 [Gallowayella weberi]